MTLIPKGGNNSFTFFLLSFVMDPIIFGLVIVLAINLIIFPIAYKQQTDKLTDITYALSFATIAVYGFIGGLSITSVSKIILTSLIIIWAMRLGMFLLNRVTQMGKDDRFDDIRTNPVRFFRFFVLQAVSSWVISLPFLFRLIKDPSINTGWDDVTSFEWIGFAIALIGLIIEGVADHQKAKFKTMEGNENKVYYDGLYSIVQFPNYLGEILFWTGIFIASLSAIEGLKWLAITSPIIIVVLLVFVTGIPTIERARYKSHKDDPIYLAYRKSKSKLIPGLY